MRTTKSIRALGLAAAVALAGDAAVASRMTASAASSLRDFD